MDHRMPLSAAATTTRPFPPQRAVSSSALYFPKPVGRPSGLSSVRSVSHSDAGVVDLTAEGARGNHGGVFGERREEVVVGSPEVIEVEDEGEQRPKKRVKLAVEEDDEVGSVEGSEDDMAHAIVPGEKLPSLPKQNTNNPRLVLGRRRRYGGELSARKASGLDPPPMATRIPPPKNAADFSPWTGHHPEDLLNETVVKVGYSDKPPSSIQTECNSAKASIWNNLSTKNSAGLQMLGYLFTQVMEKRQTLGKCNAPSTFKPPPRVTVTDTKREGWLRDLANPDVPLRKQSRTIPHGVRGKLLMDQCLSKDIPLQRAIWLAKCVGANELRAFRRKGVSGAAAATGESKWVREWTISVEQFLEGVIATCGEEDWQMKMNYSIKLVTAFYSEQLLDKDHYLDWIVASFGEADLERLPVWVVVLQIYWMDIVRFVRRGRKLALILLDRLAQLSEQSSSVNEVLRTRLQKLVAIIAVTSRGSLVMPDAWDKYQNLLAPDEMAKTNGALRAVAVSIAARNERLNTPVTKTPSNTRSPLLRLYDILDTVGLETDYAALSASCLELVPDISRLVSALFDWTASPYRQGLARVYLTTKIIKALRSRHHDTDSAISTYISNLSTTDTIECDNAYRLIGQLVREDAFSPGHYLQWLASSGAMYDHSSVQVAKSILGAIPSSSLPGHVAGLRRSLLSRLDYAAEVETVAAPRIQAVKSALENGTPESLELCGGTDSLSVKLAIAAAAETCMAETVRYGNYQHSQFQLFRSVFEATGHIAAISDLAMHTTDFTDIATLADLADTVVYHAKTLAAIGSLSDLVETLMQRYRTLRTEQPLDRAFILAMTRLVGLPDGQQSKLAVLKDDLLICEQQNTAAVCSPASDNMIGMQASSLETDEDIDAVFASGNSMDDQLLQRVFMRVLLRAGKTAQESSGETSKLCNWLSQLRIVGNGSFEELVTAYVQSALTSTQGTTKSMSAIMALVASECLDLPKVLRTIKYSSEASAIRLVVQLLLTPASAAQGLGAAEQYRYNTIQRLCCVQQAQHVAPLLMAACGDPAFDVSNAVLHDLIIEYTTTQVDVVRESFRYTHRDKPPTQKAIELSQALVARGFAGTKDTSLDIHQIVAMTSPLSVRFCAGALTYMSKDSASYSSSGNDLAKEVMIEAIESGNSAWPQLLGTAISDTTKRDLHAWAQDRLLFAIGKPDPRDEIEPQRYLDVLDLTYHSVRGEDDTAVLALLNDKLRGVERQLSSSGDEGKATSGRSQSIWQELNVLLHVCCLHVSAVGTDTDANKQARANLLITLCSLCVRPCILMDCDKAEYIFDLASALSDSLPEQALQSIARTIKPTEARVQALIGTSPTLSSDAWLALASQIPSAQSRGTAQQRALAKHAAAQSAAGPSTAARPGVVGGSSFGPSPQSQHPQPQRPWPQMGPARGPIETKITPFALRRWEIMPDSTPVMGENDTSLSLGLFGARKV